MHFELYTSILFINLSKDVLSHRLKLCSSYPSFHRIPVCRYFFCRAIQIDWLDEISFVADVSSSEMRLSLNEAICSNAFINIVLVWPVILAQTVNKSLIGTASLHDVESSLFSTFTARYISNYIYRKFTKQTTNQVREKNPQKSVLYPAIY